MWNISLSRPKFLGDGIPVRKNTLQISVHKGKYSLNMQK